jgi:hypothetical protein
MSPVAQKELGELEDLKLSREELANEAGEAAAARERELGGSVEAVAIAYQRAHDELLASAEQALNGTEPESPGPVPDELMVSGRTTERKRWSGKAPTATVLKLKAAPMKVREGGYRKGERLTLTCQAVVISEGVKDKLDKETMAAVEAVQEHTAVVLDIELADE